MTATQIAVIGARGQLGSDLIDLLGAQAWGLGHTEIEITRPESIAEVLGSQPLSCVINCAAYNWVDRAEQEPEAAFATNAFGVRHLARWCATQDVPLLQVSTDHVFGDSTGRAEFPWTEHDTPVPVSAYAASKLAGEHFVRAHCQRYWIVRTCGLYGRHAARGKGNFVETMLRLAGERTELRVVADQYCTPTSTYDLARGIVALIQTRDYGVHQITNAGDCSWYEFAAEIFRLSGKSLTLHPISSADYAAPARRPAYSVLNCARFEQATGLKLPSWQAALSDYLNSRTA